MTSWPLVGVLISGASGAVVSTSMLTDSGLDVLPAASEAVTSICTLPSATAGLTSQDQLPEPSAMVEQTSTPPMVTLISAPTSEVPDTVGVLSLVRSPLVGAVMVTVGAWMSIPPGIIVGGETLPASSSWVTVILSPSTTPGPKSQDQLPLLSTTAVQLSPLSVTTVTVAPGSPVPVMGWPLVGASTSGAPGAVASKLTVTESVAD